MTESARTPAARTEPASRIASDGGRAHSLELPPLSLYIHFPWCARKCPYCDFNSHALRGSPPESAFVAALLEDLERDLPWVQGRDLRSIYLGGGTPSLFPPDRIAQVLEGVQERVPLSAGCEITMEANPGTVTPTALKGYRAAGVNRLSIGVQSFHDRMLRALGRIHDSAEAAAAIEAALRAGFMRVNVDLMHSLPGQELAGAIRDLRRAIAYDVGHISWYQLTIEPNTLFYRRPPPLPDEELGWRIYREGTALLTNYYQHYEISAFARADERCVHNLNYWEFGDYLGIGPGAHGKITLPTEARIIRTLKFKRPDHYISTRKGRLARIHPVPPAERPLEFLLNSLRLTNGVSRQSFARRCGMQSDALDDFIARGVERKLLRRGGRIRATRRGLRYLDSLLELI